MYEFVIPAVKEMIVIPNMIIPHLIISSIFSFMIPVLIIIPSMKGKSNSETSSIKVKLYATYMAILYFFKNDRISFTMFLQNFLTNTSIISKEDREIQ